MKTLLPINELICAKKFSRNPAVREKKRII
jgi:hypothetical protein